MRLPVALAAAIVLSGCAGPLAGEPAVAVAAEAEGLGFVVAGCEGVNVMFFIDRAAADAVLPLGFTGLEAGELFGTPYGAHQVPVMFLVGQCDESSYMDGQAFQDFSLSIAVERPDIAAAAARADLDLYRMVTAADHPGWIDAWSYVRAKAFMASISMERPGGVQGPFLSQIALEDARVAKASGITALPMPDAPDVGGQDGWQVRTWTVSEGGIGWVWQNYTAGLVGGLGEACIPSGLGLHGDYGPLCSAPRTGGAMRGIAASFSDTEVHFDMHFQEGPWR